jgi:hypothetical protein
VEKCGKLLKTRLLLTDWKRSVIPELMALGKVKTTRMITIRVKWTIRRLTDLNTAMVGAWSSLNDLMPVRG